MSSVFQLLVCFALITCATCDVGLNDRYPRPGLSNGDYSFTDQSEWGNKYPEDQGPFNPLKHILEMNEQLVDDENLTVDDLFPEQFDTFTEFLTSASLLSNVEFLTRLEEMLAEEVDKHGLEINDNYEVEDEEIEEMNEIMSTGETPPETNANCTRDMDRLLLPITNQLIHLGHRIACSMGLGIVEGRCGRGFDIILNTLFPITPFTDWGISMLDFFGKPGPGITRLNIHWVGDYDACNALNGMYEERSLFSSRNITVKGKYCRLGLNRKGLNLPLGINLNWGFCLPDTCGEPDVMRYIEAENTLTAALFSMLNLEVRNTFCGHELDLAEDTTAFVIVIVLVILIVLVVLATTYDAFIRHHIYSQRMPHDTLKVHNTQLDGQPTHGDVVITPTTETQISTISNGSTNKLFQTQISVASNNTHLHEGIHNHDSQEPITCLQRFEIAFVSFSAYSNIKFMFRSKRPNGWLYSIDGFRVITAIWVLFGYSFILGTIYAESITTMNGIPKMLEWLKTGWFQLVINFHLAAETFLVITGCLVTYWWLKTVERNDGKISGLMMLRFYVHRYWRLLPTTLMVILVYAYLYKYLTEGPINPPEITDAETCKDKWWLSIFMLQNVVDNKEQCLSWSWIVAVAFQLHVITPVVLVPLVLKPFLGFIMWIVLWVVYFVSSAFVIPDVMPGGFQGMAILGLYRDIIQAPWTRASGYIVGLAVGYILYKTKCKINMHWIVSLFGWLVAGTMMLVPLFITKDMFDNGLWDEGETTAYLILSKVFFSIGVGWMIIACETGNGSGIARFLSWGAWRGLAPAIFIMMLTTPVLIFKNVYSKRQTMYLEVTQIVYHWTGNTFTIFCIALGITLLIEHPLRNISRAWFFQTKSQAVMAGHHRKKPYTD